MTNWHLFKYRRGAVWHVMFISNVVFGYLWLLNTIWVFWVDLFLICLWLPCLELFLKCCYCGPTIKARCSYDIVLIKTKRVFVCDLAPEPPVWHSVSNGVCCGNLCFGSIYIVGIFYYCILKHFNTVVFFLFKSELISIKLPFYRL